MGPDHGAQQVQRIKEAKTILQTVYISASGKFEQDPTVDHTDFKGETEVLPYFSQIIIVRTTIIPANGELLQQWLRSVADNLSTSALCVHMLIATGI